MRLFAILCYFDESPTWLAATVASLTRIGVDHVIAVDGSYLHYAGSANSGIEEADAIMRTADACGMGCTLVRPNEKLWTEQMKRDFCFKILQTMATPFVDWVTIIDADEVIVAGGKSWRQSLHDLPEDVHCTAGRMLVRVDPNATDPAPHNSDKTPEIFRNIPVPREFVSCQSRFWRVLNDMSVVVTHHTFTGVDQHGVTINIRPDIDNTKLVGMPQTEIPLLDDMPAFDHREPYRTAARRASKKAYYDLRDELGIEKA